MRTKELIMIFNRKLGILIQENNELRKTISEQGKIINELNYKLKNDVVKYDDNIAIVERVQEPNKWPFSQNGRYITIEKGVDKCPEPMCGEY